MSKITEINDPAQLEGYRLVWDALLRKTRNASHFQSLDWLLAYWRHFGADQKLRVLIVESCGETVGILPLVVRTEQTRVGAVRVCTYPLSDWGTFYGPIGSNPTATLLAGMGHLRRTTQDWDMLELRWVDNDGCDHRRTEQAMKGAGFGAAKQAWAQSSVIDTQQSWDEYVATRPTDFRRKLRRNERVVAARGKVTYVRYRPEGSCWGDSDPRWDLYKACEQLANKSWQGSSTTGTTLSHESVRDYLQDAHAAASHAGSVDLNLLLVDGKPVAFVYGYHYQGRVFALRSGFDPDYDGAGVVLWARMIEDSCARGDEQIDMGPGSLEYKRRWRSQLVTSYRYTHFAPGHARVQALRLNRWIRTLRGGNQQTALTACAG